MKVWPIITLGALLYGSTFSDSHNVGRESNPHPHRSLIDAELAETMKGFAPPHRPATFAYREYFAKLLQEGVETSDPEHKKATATGDADADADDGEDPGKKLRWHTVWPDNPGVPFTGWGDPNPYNIPDIPPGYVGNLPPGFGESTPIEDPPKIEDNVATETNTHSIMGNLPFGALKAENDLVTGGDEVGVTPCATILVNGLCPIPCTSATSALPGCKDKDKAKLDDPLGGLPVIGGDGSPGGGMGTPITGGGGVVLGGGGAVGNVPEPSTWAMLGLGFVWLAWLGRRQAAQRPSSRPRL